MYVEQQELYKHTYLFFSDHKSLIHGQLFEGSLDQGFISTSFQNFGNPCIPWEP